MTSNTRLSVQCRSIVTLNDAIQSHLLLWLRVPNRKDSAMVRAARLPIQA